MKTVTEVSPPRWALFEVVFAQTLALVLALVLALISPQQSTAAERPVEFFSRLPQATGLALSPDGKRVAYFSIGTGTGHTRLMVWDADTGEEVYLTSASNTRVHFNWLRWANNERILISARFPSSRYGKKTMETRLVSMNVADNDDNLPLYSPHRGERLSQLQDRIVDILPDDPDHILLALDIDEPTEPSVYRVNVYNAERVRLERGERNIRRWMTDRQGRLRIATSVNYNRGTTQIYHRAVGGEDRQTLFEFNRYEQPPIEALGFGVDPDVLYYTAYNGDLKALYKINLVTDERSIVYSNPENDFLGRLIYAPDNGDVIGLRGSPLPDGVVYWNEDYAVLQESVNRTLPGFDNRLMDFSRDGNIYLVRSRSNATPAVYYLGNRSGNTLEYLAMEYPELGTEPLYQREIKWDTARDGLAIKAYVSLPVAADISDGPLPTILFPHGGPGARQRTSFDYWVAFFTDRGYAVLSPDFRGSSGYGYEFSQASVQSWGLAMQDDLTDAVHWLGDEGIADPDRMCIVGGSYGGYAAMMALIKTPELFRCAVSLAGISDLVQHAASNNRFVTGNSVREYLGASNQDLRSRSPYHNAEAINAPLLLAHGENDRAVDVAQSRRMTEELKDLGKPVEYIELTQGDHYLSAQANRHTFFRAMDDFLKRHLNP